MSAGRRGEFAYFGWQPEDVPDPQDPATYARSKLDWTELNQSHHEADDHAGWLVMERGPVAVVANVGSAPVSVGLGQSATEVLLASAPGEVGLDGGRVRVGPDAVAVVALGC